MSQTLAVMTNRELILERLAKGDLVKDIAADLGIHRQNISSALAADPAYKAAQAEAIEARLEQAESDLMRSEDGLALGKNREILSHARWRAERMLPHIYARPTNAIQVNSDGPTSVKIVSWSETDGGGGG